MDEGLGDGGEEGGSFAAGREGRGRGGGVSQEDAGEGTGKKRERERERRLREMWIHLTGMYKVDTVEILEYVSSCLTS